MSDDVMVDNGDITIRVQVAGDGPVIVFVHGWPELAHSWRHQMAHFSAAGYRAAAIDVRGYGGSSTPPEVERYTLTELATDIVAVAETLSDDPVVLVGHDWGAPIVWNTAIRHPDRVRAVAGLSVPYSPAMGFSIVDLMDQLYADRFFYMLHFQDPGVVEAEFGADLATALKTAFFAISGAAPVDSFLIDAERGAPFLANLPVPPPGPLPFLTDADLAVYVDAFTETGMTGAFNRYRAIGLDATESTDIIGATVDQPSCFIAGTRDAVRHMVPGADLYADPGAACSDYRGTTLVEGAGHWVQQEAPGAVNAALEEFLAAL